MFRFSIRDVLWLMVVVALGVGWWLDHSATHKLAETYRSELMSAKIGEQVFLQGSWAHRRDAEALEQVIRYKHSGESAAPGEELIWSTSERNLAFDVDIPLASDSGLRFVWDGRPRPPDGEIPSHLKPAFNCLGVVLVKDRGHIPISTGLMTIHDSIPRSLPGSAACAIHVDTSKGIARIILPDLFRSILGDSGQHYIALYGGWRDDTTTFAAKEGQLVDTKWEFFSVRPLSIVP